MEYLFIKDKLLPTWPFDNTVEVAFIGGQLQTDYLIDAYKKGYFPWFRHEGYPVWFHPNPRCVLIPSEVHIAKSMKPYFNSHKFQLSFNQQFRQVIQACASVKRKEDGSWIDENFIEAYQKLHEIGVAKSIEVWNKEQLVGGLYYIEINSMICGESMFSTQSNASKFAFIHLAQLAEKKQVQFIDCQVSNNHLLSLGAKEIPRTQFLSYLANQHE